MMSFTYKTRVMQQGDTLQIRDGDVMAGTSIGPDGKGGFCITVHMLNRDDDAVPGIPLYKQQDKERVQ